ncbi:hypothetical protein [Hymenobacter jeollabukensis]|uniref:Uncharacterized protein n=1 Tax=Hymenobacter jeollabukensis TaxID=2025313 RepID=A0A5R8WRH3_9BACT|nr:hypothetical protein [Hymenobacter jeollabukensis]TLM93012.1 hypothetical protein FDY95_10260 [Hymenobacter jeollabukensis]
MSFFDQGIIKREVKALPKVAGYSALTVAVYMLLQIVQHGHAPYTAYLPIFLWVTLLFTLTFFVLGCTYSLIRAALQRKKPQQ